MAAAVATTITPDVVISFEINPGTLLQFLDARAESGPRLKCVEGSVTLVSPGMSHETAGSRLNFLILAVCQELGVEFRNLSSTTWFLPSGAGDTAYEADYAYYVQSHGTATRRQSPDLAIEVVVSNPEAKALRAGAFLKIPELWVLDLPRRRLTFYHLAARGNPQAKYQPKPTSRAFPRLRSAEVLGRLDDPVDDDGAFHENCRAWAREVLLPRQRLEGGGA